MILFFRLLSILAIGAIGYMFYLKPSYWIFAAAGAGFFAGVFFLSSFVLLLKSRLKRYTRELERTEVRSSESHSQVEVLEAKIYTLEKALQNALDKSAEG